MNAINSIRKRATFARVWLLFVAALSAVSLFWIPFPPGLTDGFHSLELPSNAHWLGTDSSGRDIFSVLLAGSKTTVELVLAVGVLSAAFSVLLAVISSSEKVFGRLTALVVDVLIAIPTILVAMVLAAAGGGSLAVVIFACALSYSVSISRVLRPEVLKICRTEYVAALRASGGSKFREFVHHIIPNLLPTLQIQVSIAAAYSILAEAGLTYLGYGASFGVPSWGSALSSATSVFAINPLAAAFPGMMITLTVFSLHKCCTSNRSAL